MEQSKTTDASSGGELSVLRQAARAGRLRVRRNERLSDADPDAGMVWPIEVELPCINGLSCWFSLGSVYAPDAAAQGYTDGALNDDLAQAFAHYIVAALASAPPAPTPDAGSDLAGQGEPVAYEAILAVVRAAWTLVDNTGHHDLLPLAVNRDDWDDLAARLVALKALIPPEELPAEPPHAVALFWSSRSKPDTAPDMAGQGEPVADYEQRITNLHEARQSAIRQMWEQSARADAAEKRCVELERGAVHPALSIDVQQHRDEAYQTGWDDGYAEGFAKAVAAAPAPSRPADRGTVTAEEIATVLLDRRGFGFYTDPMEGGQAAYDISCEALDEADAVLKLIAPRDAPRDAGDGTQAARDVMAERRRQVEGERWTPEHDDLHRLGEMAWAAAAYAESASRIHPTPTPPATWPWRRDEWKPSDPRRSLIKAGALILAEIERLDRLPSPNPTDGTQDTDQGGGR